MVADKLPYVFSRSLLSIALILTPTSCEQNQAPSLPSPQSTSSKKLPNSKPPKNSLPKNKKNFHPTYPKVQIKWSKKHHVIYLTTPYQNNLLANSTFEKLVQKALKYKLPLTGNLLLEIHLNLQNQRPYALTYCLETPRPISPPPGLQFKTIPPQEVAYTTFIKTKTSQAIQAIFTWLQSKNYRHKNPIYYIPHKKLNDLLQSSFPSSTPLEIQIPFQND